MNRTPMATRKRRLTTPERTAGTPSAADAREISSSAFSLQTVLSEVQQLREEQRRAQQELHQRDAEIQRLQQATGGFVEQQISPSNNISFFGDVRDRVAHSCADGGDAGARAQESRDSFRARVIKLKSDTNDGSVALSEFLVQFELIARANHWSGDAKTAILVSSLRGQAPIVLKM